MARPPHPSPLAPRSPLPAQGFSLPADPLLLHGSLPLEALAGIALREAHRTSPIFRVHRWFARRLRSQFRAILAGLVLGEGEADRFWETVFGTLSLDGAVVLDPFVGGGTALVEASRCGARVLGYDVDPVAAAITRFELGAARQTVPAEALGSLSALGEDIRRYHRTTLEDGSEREVLHHFWVQVVACGGCGRTIEAHPHYRLGWDKKKRRQHAVCRACHAIHEMDLDAEALACPCGATTHVAIGPLKGNRLTCPACGHAQPLAPADAPPRWHLFAQEYLEPGGRGLARHFKTATDADRALYEAAAAALSSDGSGIPESLRAIPAAGRSDSRPLLHGIRRYADLFNARQMLHLSRLAGALRELPRDERRLLGLAFSEHLATNCMYAAYAFGYRRLTPLFSLHAFRHVTRPVELNPWAPVGRGTFPNALRKLDDAIRFAKEPCDLDPAGGARPSGQPIGARQGVVSDDPREVLEGRAGAAVMARSAERLRELPEACVDLVLTDPPYFDNVCYSELSDFYLAWQQSLGIAEPPYDHPSRCAPLSENMAAASRHPEQVERYRDELAQVFSQCRRVLKPDGLMVFTYHHRSPKAWMALAEALVSAGLRCAGVLPMRGEGQGGLHTFEGTIKWDAVFLCRPGGNREEGWPILSVSRQNIEWAFDSVRAYRERFAAAPEAGFRAPDALNLCRALLVSRAVPGPLGPDAAPLSEALNTAATLGGNDAAPVEDRPRQHVQARL